jgi:thiol-disulfide isomerase/thioredoxin
VKGVLAPLQSAEALIQDAIKKPVVVFSKTYCPFCLKAKQTLQMEGAKFDVIEVGGGAGGVVGMLTEALRCKLAVSDVRAHVCVCAA